MYEKIYLCGAMQVYENRSEVAKIWRNKVKEYFSEYCLDFECISPTDYYEYGSDYRKSEREVMRFDLRKVKESDVILVNLRNIRQSVGSHDEIFYSYMLGKPIIRFVEEDIAGDKLINYVHEWKYEQIDRIETGNNELVNACKHIKNYYF